MPVKEAKAKASKGSVKIKVSNGRLQLVFSWGGKRRYLSLELSDSKTNRKLAEMKARAIELDIVSDNFDETLEKYKPQSVRSRVVSASPVAPAQPNLDEFGCSMLSSSAPAYPPTIWSRSWGPPSV